MTFAIKGTVHKWKTWDCLHLQTIIIIIIIIITNE